MLQIRWRIMKLNKYVSECRSAAITIQRKVRGVKQRKKGSMILNVAMSHLRMREKIKNINEKLDGGIQNDVDKFELEKGDANDMKK